VNKPEISSVAPFFIVQDLAAALSFYRDRLGFDIMFQGPLMIPSSVLSAGAAR
jgi:catechol 2,3-dioxygenase-like lactoylglutathione lyase family enzyme